MNFGRFLLVRIDFVKIMIGPDLTSNGSDWLKTRQKSVKTPIKSRHLTISNLIGEKMKMKFYFKKKCLMECLEEVFFRLFKFKGRLIHQIPVG